MRLALQALGVALALALAPVAASAATVTVEDGIASWERAGPTPWITGLDTERLSWGRPHADGGGQLSYYEFDPAADESVAEEGTTFLMGTFFVAGQSTEYAMLVSEHVTLDANAYGSAFYITTGFHGLHVMGGLVAFLFIIGRAFAAKRFGHYEATSAIVTSYYWHFVDVVWIGLFLVIYVLR